MNKRNFAVLLLLIAICGSVIAQEANDQTKYAASNYEKFVRRKDSVILSQNIQMGSGYGAEAVTANVAWQAGILQKHFSATIARSVTIDFDQLAPLIRNLDKLIAAIDGEFATRKATGLGFAGNNGLSLTCYKFVNDKGIEQTAIYGYAKENMIINGSSADPIVHLRDLLVKTRDKLIALGAKPSSKRR